MFAPLPRRHPSCPDCATPFIKHPPAITNTRARCFSFRPTPRQVALSRAKSLETTRIFNFSNKVVKAHPSVRQFYVRLGDKATLEAINAREASLSRPRPKPVMSTVPPRMTPKLARPLNKDQRERMEKNRLAALAKRKRRMETSDSRPPKK